MAAASALESEASVEAAGAVVDEAASSLSFLSLVRQFSQQSEAHSTHCSAWISSIGFIS